MSKKDGLENNLCIFNPGDSVSLTGGQELGFIFGRLLDDPGGFTCMQTLKTGFLLTRLPLS